MLPARSCCTRRAGTAARRRAPCRRACAPPRCARTRPRGRTAARRRARCTTGWTPWRSCCNPPARTAARRRAPCSTGTCPKTPACTPQTKNQNRTVGIVDTPPSRATGGEKGLSFKVDARRGIYPQRAPITEGESEYTRSAHQSQKGWGGAASTRAKQRRASLGPKQTGGGTTTAARPYHPRTLRAVSCGR
eukprot:3290676-Pyramimonas_sp.AAC.1